MKMTFTIIVGGGFAVFLAVVMAAVFIPGWVWNPPQTYIAHPYTDLEARGRVVYYSNGCNYCHTQYTREFDNPPQGPPSMGGNYVFDNPLILGSERTGPDLQYIGRKRSEAWEIEHWKDPRKMSPMSIMPSFAFLSDADLKAMASYINNLGDRVSSQWMIQAPFEYAGLKDPLLVPAATPPPDGSSQGWATWNAAGLQEGKELYVERCLTCHGCAGNGLGHYAGTQVVTPADFKQEPFRSMPDDQWFWHVSEGVQGSVMPPWKESLTVDQRWRIIRYIQQEFARPSERDPDEGDPSGPYANVTNPLPNTTEIAEEGKHIYIRECMVCHGDAGTSHGQYRNGLLPLPADFSDLEKYATYVDADYFWRISEGLPWSSMPSWKIQYGEEDRWKLVTYLRVNFTQSQQRPKIGPPQQFLDIALAQHMPAQKNTIEEVQTGGLPEVIEEVPTYEGGKAVYTQQCAHCHGLTGMGDGWDGAYLDVKPVNFTTEEVRGLSDGDWFARVTYGIQNSAMPSWSEWLPIRDRWKSIKFAHDAFAAGLPAQSRAVTPTIASVMGNGAVAVNFATLSLSDWLDEGHTISTDNGMQIYGQYCSSCHGLKGQGNGPGTSRAVPGPAAFPNQMPEAYIYWRVWDGVPDTIMPPFSLLLSSSDIWDVTAYLQDINGSPVNGEPVPGATPLPGLPTPAATPTPSPQPTNTPGPAPTQKP